MQRPDEQAIPLAAKPGPRLKFGPTITILGLALAVRLLVIWTVVTHYPAQWLFTRGMEMGLLAKSLLAGKGLSSPFGGDTGPTAIVAPVYPILVAATFRLFGEYSMASAIAIMAAQTMVNLVTIWLIMHVALRLFNQSAATLSGLVWACSLPLAWMPTILWETSVSCCLLAVLFAIVLHHRALPDLGPNHWMTLGGYSGLSALVNPALLPSFVAVVLWLAYQKREKQRYRPLLSLLTFVLVFAPWPVRNARVFHAFVPLRTTVGLELWMGNRDGAKGYLDESVFPMFNRKELADYTSRGEVGYSAHKSELAKQYIAAHPGAFVSLTAQRFIRFWSGTGTQHGSWTFAAHAMLTTFFSMSALILLIRHRRYEVAMLFALPMLLFPLPYIITHAEFRYRLVLDPIVTIAASYAMAELYSLIERGNLSSEAAPLDRSTAKTPVWRSV